MRPIARACALAVPALLLALCAAPARAQDEPPLNPTGRVLELSSPVEDSGVVAGDLTVRIDTESRVSVEAEALLALFSDSWSEALLERVRAAADAEGRLGLTTLDDVLEAASFDSGRLTLVLAVSPAERRREVIGLGASRGAENRAVRAPEPFAAHVNVRTSSTLSRREPDAEPSSTDTSFVLDLDGLARLGGPVLAYELGSTPDGDGGIDGIARHSTRLLVDMPAREMRLTVGDLSSRSRPFQPSVDVLGIGLGRDFALSPGRNVRPRGTRGFELQRPATVTVVANGEPLRRLDLREGVYTLEDLPLVTGANAFELVIEDESGAIERIPFGLLYDTSLLDVDELDFDFVAGVLSDQGPDGIEYFEDAPFASVYLRRGVRSWLTGGVGVQLEREAAQIGLDALAATPFGPLALELNVSRDRAGRSGYALGLGYSIAAETRFGQRRLTFAARHASADFSEIDGRIDADAATDGADEDPIGAGRDGGGGRRDELVASYTEQLGAALYTNLTASRSYDAATGEDTRAIGAGLQGRLFLGDSLSWSLQANHQRDATGESTSSVSIGIGLVFDRRNSISSFYSSSDEALGVDYRRRVNSDRIGGYNAGITVESDRETDGEARVFGSWLGNRLFAEIEQGVRVLDAETGDRELDTTVRLETAVATAGGRVAVGRPIGDSFAIVSKHATLGERRLRLDPDASGDAARSGILGPALFPSLGRYRDRALVYGVDDLPLGYDLGDGLFRLRPPLGAGYALTVGSAASVTVIGNLVDAASGEPIALVSGKAVALGDEGAEPVVFFTNRGGKFALSGITPGVYRLELDGGTPRAVELEVEETDQSFLRIGDVAVP